MRVVITPEAVADLDAIAEHIAQDAPRRAVSFLAELRASCRAIGQTPQAHPVLPRHPGSGTRRRVHGCYLILYVVTDRGADVIRVLHGAQDVEALLFPKGQP